MDRIIELLLNGPEQMVDKSLTVGGLYMGLFVVVSTLVFLYIYSRIETQWLKQYLTVVTGVFIFEVFTSPMWVNNHLGDFGYAYQDVSWVLTLGWSTLMLSIVTTIDYLLPRYEAWKRFLLYIMAMALLGYLAEVLVTSLGLRTYAPEIIASISGVRFIGVPIETFYYIPVFSSLVLGLYVYWSYSINNRAVVPIKVGWLRRFIISVIGVLLFEIMIEPMVQNLHLPTWSYIFHDISIILTFGWILIVWVSISIVETLWTNFSIAERFLLTVVTGGILALPFESFLIRNGYRVYEGTSAGNAFSGVVLPFLHTPMEVTLAIPMYLALVVGFVRAWDIMLTNKLLVRVKTNTKNTV